MALTSDNTRDFWQQRYRDDDTPWDRGGINPALSRWLGHGIIAPPASILVPGCGRGHEVLALAEWGFRVTAIDLSTRALAELEKRLTEASLEATLVEADLLSWQAPEPFDAVYEQTCLCALLPRYWPDYAARLCQWLQPNGLLLALFMQSNKRNGVPYHCALPDMRALFDSRNWQWPHAEPEAIPHPRNVFEYAVVLRRRPDARDRGFWLAPAVGTP